MIPLKPFWIDSKVLSNIIPKKPDLNKGKIYTFIESILNLNRISRQSI